MLSTKIIIKLFTWLLLPIIISGETCMSEREYLFSGPPEYSSASDGDRKLLFRATPGVAQNIYSLWQSSSPLNNEDCTPRNTNASYPGTMKSSLVNPAVMATLR